VVIGEVLLELLDILMERRLARRRRVPVQSPALFVRCAARDPRNRRCVLAAGHAEQHQPMRSDRWWR